MLGRSTPAILPVFLPHRGCPARCIFCDQRVQTGVVSGPSPVAAAEDLRRELCALQRRGRRAALAFYGGSFDGLDDAERGAWLALASELVREGLVPEGVRISAHPAGLTPARIEELQRGGVRTIEIGVQSLDDAVLAGVRRGHDAAEAVAACRRVQGAGLDCIVQLMMGLPGADASSDEATARGVAALGPAGARIHPTLVLRGTPLAMLLRDGQWAPPELDEAVGRVAGMASIIEAAGVPVLRLGVQEVDGLGARVLAGAWHPAFGELVRGELLAQRLAAGLGEGETAVRVARREASLLLGHGRRGLRRLEALAGRRIEAEIV